MDSLAAYVCGAIKAGDALAAGIPTLALVRDPKKSLAWPKGATPIDGLAAVRRWIESKSG